MERKHENSSGSGLSSNSSGYSSNEPCVVNEGNNIDINKDSDCLSQSVSTEKHPETHLNEEIHSRFPEKHVPLDKNSGKIHPVVEISDETMREIDHGRQESESVEHCGSPSYAERYELDHVSSYSTASTGNDLNCVGIKRLETSNDVVSSVVAEKHVTQDNKCQTQQMLYNLYTISVSMSNVLLYAIHSSH